MEKVELSIAKDYTAASPSQQHSFAKLGAIFRLAQSYPGYHACSIYLTTT